MDEHERDLVEPEGVNAGPGSGPADEKAAVVGPPVGSGPAEESDPAPPLAAEDSATRAAGRLAPGQELAEGEG
ncbi:MAG: hypothetical protein M3Z02_06950 [Actinomycetota bacterium]|nr:hypothetical protein [Actinomycetota bacterium]